MEKILLIEDDKVISQGINLFLTDEGYSITNIYNYEEFKKINLDTIDLVLLDINLPDINGIKLFEEIKKVKNIPIIFLTANDQEINIVKCLDMGADDYITKPFKISILLSRIKLALRRNQNKNIIKIRNLEIDLLKNKVVKNNKEIFLSKVEYRILVILAQDIGVIKGSKEILKEVWDTDYDIPNYENTLSVYIKRLREKIEDDPSNPVIIQTIRKKGYVINEK